MLFVKAAVLALLASAFAAPLLAIALRESIAFVNRFKRRDDESESAPVSGPLKIPAYIDALGICFAMKLAGDLVGLFAAGLLDMNLGTFPIEGGFSVAAIVVGVLFTLITMVTVLQGLMKFSSSDATKVFAVYIPLALLIIGLVFGGSWWLFQLIS